MYNFIDFFPTRKSGNYFVRNSRVFSFTSHAKLRMRDKNFCTVTYFICISVLTTWQFKGYFILFFTFLFNNCIDKLLGYCRVTFDNHLFLGILKSQYVLRVFQVAFGWFGICLLFDIFVFVMVFVIWRIFYLAFVWQLRFNLYSSLVFLSCGIQVKAREELDESFTEPVHLLACNS